MVFSDEYASTTIMENQTPLPIFEDSGMPNLNIITYDHQRRPCSPVESTILSQQRHSSISPSNNAHTYGPIGGLMDEDNNVDSEFFDSLPPGYRFCPTDSDLIVHYLQRKIDNETLPRNQIRHINLYRYSPEHIAEKYPPVGEKEWYFFTPRDRKYRNGTRPNRAAGFGYWKATGADKAINYKGTRVGFRKALVYYEGKPPKGFKTNWIMHEYRVDGSPRPKTSLADMRLDDFVLCRIYKKIDKSFKPRPHKGDQDDDTQTQIEYPTNQGTKLFDDTSVYFSEMDIKNDLQASPGLIIQSQCNNGQSFDISRGMDSSFGNFSAKYYMSPTENTSIPRYVNEGSKLSTCDYDIFSLHPEIDFRNPIAINSDLDTLINNTYKSS